MAVPTYTSGQVLSATDCNNWFVPAPAYKTADLARTTTTQTADPDLTVGVAANATYHLDLVMFYKGLASGNNLQWTFTIPAGSSPGLYFATYIGSGGVIAIEGNQWTDTAHTAGSITAGVVYGLHINGLLNVGGTAANFTVNWAASGGTVTVSARSKLVLQRIG